MTQRPLFNIHADDAKGVHLMDVTKMVSEALKGLKEDHLEIRPGLSNILKLMSRVAPQFILNRLSRTVRSMRATATPLYRVTQGVNHGENRRH